MKPWNGCIVCDKREGCDEVCDLCLHLTKEQAARGQADLIRIALDGVDGKTALSLMGAVFW